MPPQRNHRWSLPLAGLFPILLFGCSNVFGPFNNPIDPANPSKATYTVTYNGNSGTGGSAPSDKNRYVSGATVAVLGNTGTLVKTGHYFLGWNTMPDGTGTSYLAGATFTMNGANLTLYAYWATGAVVTYNGNANNGGAVPVDTGSYAPAGTVKVLGNTGGLSKTGYTYQHWNTASDGSGVSYNSGQTFVMGDQSVMLYAQWAVNSYSLTYSANTTLTSGSAPSPVTQNYGTSVTLPSAGTMAESGYTFTGWNTQSNGSGSAYAAGAAYEIAGNTTLYAQWSPNGNTVTFNANGGSGIMANETIATGNSAALTANAFTRTGYSFSGWNTDAGGAGTGYANGQNYVMSSASVTLYAQWTAIAYTVTYNGNDSSGGSAPSSVTQNYNTTFTVAGAGSLSLLGYTFSGWNTAADGSGISYPAGSTYTFGAASVTLYAQWTPTLFAVSYNGNGNTGGRAPIDGNSYFILSQVKVLGNTGSLVKTGFTFAHWNTAADGSGTSYSPGATFTFLGTSVILYAQWH